MADGFSGKKTKRPRAGGAHGGGAGDGGETYIDWMRNTLLSTIWVTCIKNSCILIQLLSPENRIHKSFLFHLSSVNE